MKTEAITINYTRNKLLNSKNEYMANCLTRICVEENRFEKSKRERDEELAEEVEKQRLMAFKQKHLRPKRTRDEAKKPTDEPTGKRMKLFLEAGNPPDSDDLDMADWLEKDEERCRRVNELKARLAEDKQRVLDWMNNKKKEEEAIPKGWKAKTDLDSDEEDKPVPKGWKSSPAEERVEEDNLPTGRVTGGPSQDGNNLRMRALTIKTSGLVTELNCG